MIIQEKKLAFIATTETFRQVSGQAKQQRWDRFCEECDPNDQAVTNKFWELAKSMGKTVGGVNHSPQEIIDDNGHHLTIDEEKGEALLERYWSLLQPASHQ